MNYLAQKAAKTSHLSKFFGLVGMAGTTGPIPYGERYSSRPCRYGALLPASCQNHAAEPHV